jgi:hypothetical protein
MNLLQARMDQGEHSGLSLSLNSNNRGGTVYKVGQSDEFLSVLHIRRIRIILGSWIQIRIRIKVECWIRIRIRIKVKSLRGLF